MNIPLALQIISEVESHPAEPVIVHGREAAHEVQRMAAAGLIRARDAATADEHDEAVITGVTHAGHHFYRALRNVRSYARG